MPVIALRDGKYVGMAGYFTPMVADGHRSRVPRRRRPTTKPISDEVVLGAREPVDSQGCPRRLLRVKKAKFGFVDWLEVAMR